MSHRGKKHPDGCEPSGARQGGIEGGSIDSLIDPALADEWSSFALSICRVVERFNSLEGVATYERMALVIEADKFFDGIRQTTEVRKFRQLAGHYRATLHLRRSGRKTRAREFLLACDLRRLAQEADA